MIMSSPPSLEEEEAGVVEASCQSQSFKGRQLQRLSETLYLTWLVLMRRFQQEYCISYGASAACPRPDPNYLFQQRRALLGGDYQRALHSCSPERCKQVCLRKGQPFLSPVDNGQHSASGIIYVCSVTGSVHECKDSCALVVRTRSAEGFTCPISGLVKGAVVNCCGHRNPSPEGEEAEEEEEEVCALPQPQRRRDASQLVRSWRSLDLESSSRSSVRRRCSRESLRRSVAMHLGYGGSAPSSTISHEAAVQYAMLQPPGAVCGCSKTTLAKWYRETRSMCGLLSSPQYILRTICDAVRGAERTALANINAYLIGCAREGAPPASSLTILSLHAQSVMPHMSCLLERGLQHPSSSDIETYVELIMRGWDILCSTPYGLSHSLSFSISALALLYALRDGHSLRVQQDAEGYIYKVPPRGVGSHMKELCIQMVVRQPQLQLVDSSCIGRVCEWEGLGALPSQVKAQGILNHCYLSLLNIHRVKLNSLEVYRLGCCSLVAEHV